MPVDYSATTKSEIVPGFFKFYDATVEYKCQGTSLPTMRWSDGSRVKKVKCSADRKWTPDVALDVCLRKNQSSFQKIFVGFFFSKPNLQPFKKYANLRLILKRYH